MSNTALLFEHSFLRKRARSSGADSSEPPGKKFRGSTSTPTENKHPLVSKVEAPPRRHEEQDPCSENAANVNDTVIKDQHPRTRPLVQDDNDGAVPGKNSVSLPRHVSQSLGSSSTLIHNIEQPHRPPGDDPPPSLNSSSRQRVSQERAATSPDAIRNNRNVNSDPSLKVSREWNLSGSSSLGQQPVSQDLYTSDAVAKITAFTFAENVQVNRLQHIELSFELP